ncbi:MAG: DegT/DnrJ/EryC1/StrS family aminotransferase [Fibrobacteria bacterium]|nr:DegT/DnrJ/EryC1/StrS family aminotransferase [Fibrobacteria bacterium]
MIPFVDLKTQYFKYKDEFQAAMASVLENTSFILGGQVKDFEDTFAVYCETDYAIGVASGTDALHLALRAVGIKAGDEVITQTNTFYATSVAVELAGAKPVFVDCTPDTYMIDINKLEQAITSKTKAIIPVHLYGQTAPMEAILEIAKKHDLLVLEDACQAHGSMYKGKRAGSLADIAAFSFYPGKNLGAFGDGGAITTNNQELYEKVAALRNYGSAKKYYHDCFGTNSRLDSLQAAVLSVKLKKLDAWNLSRQRAAARYISNLQSCESITLPVTAEHATHIYHLFVIQTETDRDDIIQKLAEKEIFCGIHYPVPLHKQKAYDGMGHKQGDFPVAEAAGDKILSLPMFPELTDEQIDTVCEELLKLL